MSIKQIKQDAVLFLGAGFSKAGGLPLTRELFDAIPTSPYPEHLLMYKKVKSVWDDLKMEASTSTVEGWIKLIYENRNDLPEFKYGVTWDEVRDFFLARLVNVPPGRNSQYYYGITTEIQSDIHKNFWKKILQKYNVKDIITTNYDILIEQGLKTEYTGHRAPPRCFYAGHPYNLKVKKNLNITKKVYAEIELGKEFCLYKLHGSLNWSDEPHAYKVHDDVRAVYRKSESGKPKIIPPLTEKKQPLWAYDIWTRAENALRNTNIWFFCGYSCPSYDIAIGNLLRNSSVHNHNLKVIISDIDGKNVAEKLTQILPKSTEYKILDGLPDCLKMLTT